jgi:hypothetical protein
MKRILLAALLFLSSIFPAAAQEYYDIDVDVPQYPEMQPVPDSPVYYAPGVDSNYFFYDGTYWDYYNDRWYASPWYNGPWSYVDPIYIPTYVLWVPISYYHRHPGYWHGWNVNGPPHWSQHWGSEWQARHNDYYRGSSRGNTRAPLPDYQRGYSRANYPRGVQQQGMLHSQNYAYRPQERVVQQHYQQRGISQGAPQVQQRAPTSNPAARADSRERR